METESDILFTHLCPHIHKEEQKDASVPLGPGQSVQSKQLCGQRKTVTMISLVESNEQTELSKTETNSQTESMLTTLGGLGSAEESSKK